MTNSNSIQASNLKQNKPISITQWQKNICEHPNAKWVAVGGGSITHGLFLTFSVRERTEKGNMVESIKTMIGYIPSWLQSLARQHKANQYVVKFETLNLLRIEDISLGKGKYTRVKPFSVTLTSSACRKITNSMMGGDLESRSGCGLSGSCVVFNTSQIKRLIEEGKFLDDALDQSMHKLERDHRFDYGHFNWDKTNLVSMNSLIMDTNNLLLTGDSCNLTVAKSKANEIGEFLYTAWNFCKNNNVSTADPLLFDKLPNYLLQGLNDPHYRGARSRSNYMRRDRRYGVAYS